MSDNTTKHRKITVCRAATFVALLMLVFCTPAFCEKGEYVLGGAKGWACLASSDAIEIDSGRYGYEALEIADKTSRSPDTTDLFLDFENGRAADSIGRYRILSNQAEIISGSNTGTDAARGKGSALFWGNGGITLQGTDSAMLGRETLANSFSIEFFMMPIVCDSGDTILSWHSSRNLDRYSLYQMLSVYFDSSVLHWDLRNVFDNFTEENNSVELKGSTKLIPKEWSFHQLSYEAESGLLEYRVNGRLEDMVFVTDSARQNGSVFLAHFGVAANLELAPSFCGKIDDFCISYLSTDDSALEATRYPVEGGYFESEIFLVAEHGATMESIRVDEFVPAQTATAYYVRCEDTPYNWTDSYPEWHLIDTAENRAVDGTDLEGCYFQVAGFLYPDGSGEQTPTVTQIVLDYNAKEQPFPPFGLKAESGSNKVTLSWKPAPAGKESPVGGYLVYYGTRSGEYMGTVALQGDSPVNAGNVCQLELSGLRNGTIYYFAVASYLKGDISCQSVLSDEVYARPGLAGK
ncbi:MAG: fibronectin type III domain-containing protein [Treponemataceae bacterium]|nr:fibronectin type III domain-containing protein [Treponemataceae bacterium]